MCRNLPAGRIVATVSHPNCENAEASPIPADRVEADPLRKASLAMWASVAASWGERADYVDARGAVVTQAMLDAADLALARMFLSSPAAPAE